MTPTPKCSPHQAIPVAASDADSARVCALSICPSSNTLPRSQIISDETKNSRRNLRREFFERTISRVLYLTAINLVRALPHGSVPPAKIRRTDAGSLPFAYGVASDRVYTCTQSPAVPVSSYLAFSSLPRRARRLFSVALSRESPPADVIRYPVL